MKQFYLGLFCRSLLSQGLLQVQFTPIYHFINICQYPTEQPYPTKCTKANGGPVLYSLLTFSVTFLFKECQRKRKVMLKDRALKHEYVHTFRQLTKWPKFSQDMVEENNIRR